VNIRRFGCESLGRIIPYEDKEVHLPELATDFQSLPEEYQLVIRLAEETHKIAVAPLQLLVGGWSGAVVYLVSVSNNETKRVEHCILKLDRKGNSAKSDEVTRHNTLIRKSTPEFARDHIAELVFDRIEHDGAIAIFYRIAGQSLLKYRPLSNYERQSQLRNIFAETNKVLLTEWNSSPSFEAIHPQKILQKWLGFRLNSGGNIESFLQETLHVNPDIPGLLVNGHVFPTLNSAREVGAAMVELQAAMRLSRLWQNQGKSEQARELLNAAYSKITEGFTTADMKEANALLAALSS